MRYIPILKAPKDSYSDYTFWRAWHQRNAILVILGAAAFALGRWW